VRGPLLLVSRPDGLKRGDSSPKPTNSRESLAGLFTPPTGLTIHQRDEWTNGIRRRKPPPRGGGVLLRRDSEAPGWAGARSCMGWVKDPQSSFLRRHYPDQVQRMFQSEDRTLSR